MVKRISGELARKRLNKMNIAVVLTGSLFFGGCQALPFLSPKPENTVPAVTGASQASIPTNTSQPTGTKGSAPLSTPTNSSLPVATTTPSIGRQALDRYQEARENLSSEKMSHYWSVESNYPLKTGVFHREVNYDAFGELATAWGSVEESDGVDIRRSFWYRTEDEFALVANGVLKRYPLSQVQDQVTYDLESLLQLILTDFSVSRQSGSFYVQLNTQQEALIQELMEDLGYRKTEAGAYEGSLYLEAMLDEASGQLKTLNYVFTQRVAGYKDNGSILLSGFNEPVTVVIPDPADLPVKVDPLDPETQPGQP